MQLSVAMAVFQGAAYLGRQLESIAAGAVLPDELVVCDDGSTDSTPAIVERFAAAAPFPVRLQRSDRRLGTAANFARAIGLCRGEWIVLADQDDIWRPEKLARLRQAILRDPALALVFHDAELVGLRGEPLGRRLWQAVRFGRRQQRQVRAGRLLDALLRHNTVTGATMAFRACHRDLLLPIPEGWVHDAWIALVLSAIAPAAALAEPLVDYRQHPAQQIGQPRRGLWAQYRRARERGVEHYDRLAAQYEAARERLLGAAPLARPDALQAIATKCLHFRAKARMRSSLAARVPLVLGELVRLRYARYSSGWRSLAQDLFC
jgi:glycosyltransferase involved in cell wall biosynthesis